jgi:alkanesulfonate monooxygenase SsuD/methylene tetrahydromethanopterin reductase-like flavin-dependent oxidoreductase (luciferase family)
MTSSISGTFPTEITRSSAQKILDDSACESKRVSSSVSTRGRFHTLDSVNIVPPPVQRPIPIWFGGSSDAVIRRVARLGDGWMPIIAPDAAGEAKLAMLRVTWLNLAGIP